MNSKARTGLVTGSNRGIGAGIALRLAADGVDVAINYLEGDAEAEAIAAQIRAMGRQALLVPADLRDPHALTAMMERVLQAFGTLDILVNNAGVGLFSPFLETTLQTWTETMDTNLRAAFLCSQIAALLDIGDMEVREAALNPTGRIGTPNDIAAMVAFLVSDEAGWVNGQNIVVDGGLTALSPQPPYDVSA